MSQSVSSGRIVKVVVCETIVPAIVTAVFENTQINAHLFRDGVNQEHLPTHVYTFPYAPVNPEGKTVDNSWHWPQRD